MPLIPIALALAQFVPDIVRWVTGSKDAENIAEKVVDIAKNVTGAANGDDALKAIEADPNLAMRFQVAVMDNRLALERIAYEDRQGDRELLKGQIELNKIEAGSSSFWASGWRPAVGWAGVSALFFATTIPFAVQTGMWVYQCIAQGAMIPAPTLDTGAVIVLLGQILGVSVQAIGRTMEKKAGVAS